MYGEHYVSPALLWYYDICNEDFGGFLVLESEFYCVAQAGLGLEMVSLLPQPVLSVH